MLHFTSVREWERGRAAGIYEPHAMAQDGFVHLSYGHQLARVATERAAGRDDLVVLVVDPEGFGADLRVEGGFPHVYRPIPVSAVKGVFDLPPDADGSFVLPEAARLAELELTALPSFDHVLERCRKNMAGFEGRWWIGGGWACDAVAGTVSRPHLDVDVVVLRPDLLHVSSYLADWDVRVPCSGTLEDWDGRELSSGDHQLWLRPADGFRPHRWQEFAADPGFFEILAEDFDPADEVWRFRRDHGVCDRVERLGSPAGFLRAEVALLYKAAAAAGADNASRAKAEGDFAHAAGHLDEEQRSWLSAALARAHGSHHWIAALGSSPSARL